MASGVTVADEVVLTYREMRVHRTGENTLERFKFVLFMIDNGKIIVDPDGCVKVKDVQDDANVFKKLMSMLQPKQCRYALYDCHYSTDRCPMEDLVFILWCPAEGRVHDRMLYASSKDALKKIFTGIKCELQLNDISDLKDESVFLDKLAKGTIVTKLEGKDL